MAEDGGINVYSFVLNSPIAFVDAQGKYVSNVNSVTAGPGTITYGPLYPSGQTDCCNSQWFDPTLLTCCSSGALVPLSPVYTGIRMECRAGVGTILSLGLVPSHCWLAWGNGPLPSDTAGLYASTWNVAYSASHVETPDVTASGHPFYAEEEYYVMPCCDVDALRDCVEFVTHQQFMNFVGTPTYILGAFDCRHYPSWVVSICAEIADCQLIVAD